MISIPENNEQSKKANTSTTQTKESRRNTNSSTPQTEENAWKTKSPYPNKEKLWGLMCRQPEPTKTSGNKMFSKEN